MQYPANALPCRLRVRPRAHARIACMDSSDGVPGCLLIAMGGKRKGKKGDDWADNAWKHKKDDQWRKDAKKCDADQPASPRELRRMEIAK